METIGSYTTNLFYGQGRILTDTDITIPKYEENFTFYINQNILNNDTYLSHDKTAGTINLFYDVWGRVWDDDDDYDESGKHFTGYTYDNVIGKHFAQFRFYDATNKGFMAVDPIKDGDNWYVYCNNNPSSYIDPLGLFLPGTVLEVGAKGEDVQLLNKVLVKAGYGNARYIWEEGTDTFSIYTKFALQEYLKSNSAIDKNYQNVLKAYSSKDGTKVDLNLWNSLGLSDKVNSTIEEEFWSGTKGNNNLKITLKDNTMTIDYFPKIYICQVSNSVYNQYEKKIVDGIKKWSNSNVGIQGVKIDIIVNVTPSKATKKNNADIILAAGKEGASFVPGAINWNYNKKNTMYLSDYKRLEDLVFHEFGHKLGLFDAYTYRDHFEETASFLGDKGKDIAGDIGEKLLPSVPYNISPYDSIMRNEWSNSKFTAYSLDYEMILYAWKNNELQLYIDSLLSITGDYSEAFKH